MKTYPLVSDYKNVVIESESFARLKHLEPCYVGHSLYFASGGPAVVFKMKDSKTEKYVALKCFTKEQSARAVHFEAISEHLRTVCSPYFVPYTYYEEEIWANDAEYPVLSMPWIEGETLSSHITKLCNEGDTEALAEIASRFDRMALWLLDQDLAHGDLKPDNIIVTPEGRLMLVDYDGMFVPSLKDAKSLELGTAEYRHPKRSPSDFNKHLDDFPILVLSLSLHALAKSPDLYTKAHGGDALLFKPEDYKNLLAFQHLAFFQNNADDEVIYSRFSMLMYSVMQPVIELVGLRGLLEETAWEAEEYIPWEIEEVAEGDGWVQNEDGTWLDSYGVKFSEDRKVLLKTPKDIVTYSIHDSVTKISPCAFAHCTYLTSIFIPDTVKEISWSAFEGCTSLISIIIPRLVTHIGTCTFHSCTSLTSIDIPNNVTKIGGNAFKGCTSLKNVAIKRKDAIIDERAFEGCTSLLYITVAGKICYLSLRDNYYKTTSPNKVNATSSSQNIGTSDSIEKSPTADDVYGWVQNEDGTWLDSYGVKFSKNKKKLLRAPEYIVEYNIPNSVITIAGKAFKDCTLLASVTIPNSVKEIRYSSFSDCISLESILIPSSADGLAVWAFENCTSLKSVTMAGRKSSFYESTFNGCTSLAYITVAGKVYDLANCPNKISVFDSTKNSPEMEDNSFFMWLLAGVILCCALWGIKLAN